MLESAPQRFSFFPSLLILWSNHPLGTDHWLFCIPETATLLQSTHLLSFFVLLIVQKPDIPRKDLLCSLSRWIIKKAGCSFLKKPCVKVFKDNKIPQPLKVPLIIVMYLERIKASVLSFEDAHFSYTGEISTPSSWIKVLFFHYNQVLFTSRRNSCTSFVFLEWIPFL